MDTEKYLQYLHTVHDRISTKAAREGISIWALAGAAVYLMSQLAQEAPPIWQTPNTLSLTVLIFVHLFVGFDLLVTVITPGGLERRRSSDYRVFQNFDSSVMALGIFQLTWAMLLPALASGLASVFTDDLPRWQVYTLRLNALFFAIVYTIVIAQIFNSLQSIAKTGLPLPAVLGLQRTRLVRYVSFVFVLLLLMISLANMFWLVSTIARVPVSLSKNVLITSFYSVILIYVIKYLIDSLTRERPLGRIERLERDILFSNLCDREVRERIEEEFLGQEVSSVLREKLAALHGQADVLKAVLSEVEGLGNGSGDNKEMWDSVRLDELSEKFNAKSGAFMRDSGVLLAWLKNALTHTTFLDDFVQQLLGETLQGLEELVTEMAQKTAASEALLKKWKKQIV